jgi:hypothetical protein
MADEVEASSQLSKIAHASHRKLMDLMACSNRDQHGISADHRTFLACGESFPIPQVSERAALMENAPAGSNREAYATAVVDERSRSAGRPKPETAQFRCSQ